MKTGSGEAIDLAVEELGDASAAATPMLIAHGLFGSKRNWASHAARFAEKRRVCPADMRNHGESPWAEDMRYTALGADIARALAVRFDRSAILLGHSMGGKAAMAAALTEPERVQALIVVDIAPVDYQNSEHLGIVRAMRAADLSGVTRRSQVEPALAEAAPDPALRAFLLQNLAFENTPEGRRARWTPNLATIEHALPDLVGWPEGLTDRQYEGPVLFVAGRNSPYVDAAGEAAARRAFPRMTIERLPTGHWPHAERPTAFFETVDRWLDGLGKR